MVKKGQAEFIVVFGVVIIGIVIALYAFKPTIINPVPPSLQEEKKLIKNSIINLIRSGTKETLETIYRQGGYYTLSGLNTIEYGMEKIPIWQAGDELETPNIVNEIEDGLKSYLLLTLKPKMEFYGKNVTFELSRLGITTKLLKGKLSISVYLPTKLEGYDIEQPYNTELKTELYDVIDFSKNFANDLKNTRYFESMTLKSIVLSNPDNEYWLPSHGVITGCGKRLFKTRAQMLESMKRIIRYTVSHIVWNDAPLIMEGNPFSPLKIIGGKNYPNLDVAFVYPNEWDSKIDQYFSADPEPLSVTATPLVPFVPVCITPYSVKYSAIYPVIIMVKDSEMNNWFWFAVIVGIEDNMPGNFTMNLGEMKTEYKDLCIERAECHAKINVTDTEGNPIEGADAMFYICDIGKTDANGIVEGNIPCMASELKIFKNGYKTFGDFLLSNDVNGIDITMEKRQDNITLHLYGLPIKASGNTGNGEYESYERDGHLKPIDEFYASEFNISLPNRKALMVILSFSPLSPNYYTGEDITLTEFNTDENNQFVSQKTIEGVYPSEFYVSGVVVNNETRYSVGYINGTYVLEEGQKDIYVNIPVVTNADDLPLSESINSTQIDKIYEPIINCGLQPVDNKKGSC